MKKSRFFLRPAPKSKKWRKLLRRPKALAGSVAVAAVSLIAGSFSDAANYWWDNSGIVEPGQSISTGFGLGGAGAYDGVLLRFWDGTSLVDAATVTASDVIYFGGQAAGGAITLNAPLTVNGLTFTTGNYTTTLTAVNTLTLDGTAGTPVVTADANATIGTAAIAGIVATNGFTKAGAGTLTVVGNNTGITGPVTLNGGTLISSGNVNALGSGAITLQLGTLSLRENGAASNSVAPVATYANSFIVNGNSTLNVDRASANTNNTIAIASLSINNSQLTITNGNAYGLKVTGATSLAGPLSTISTGLTFTAGNANPTSNMVAFSGGVSGAGALNKLGTGTVNLFGANTYSGGTNIFAGAVTLADSTAVAGTGSIIVNPGAAIAFTNTAGATLSGAQTLSVQSAANSLGIIRLDSTVSDIVTGSSLGSAFVSPYGMSFQVNTGQVNYTAAGVPGGAATYNQNINLGAIGTGGAGSGPIYFGAAANTTMSGTITAAADGVLRFGGSGILTLATADQLATPNPAITAVTFGTPVGNVFAVAGGSGTFAINNKNAFASDPTITINKLTTVQVAGTAVGTDSPLGLGTINILAGTLDTTATNYVGINGQLANNTINVYQTNTATNGLLLNNSAVNNAGGTTNLRFNSVATLGLYSGNLTFTGSNTATTTTQQDLAVVNASGGSTIHVTTSATAANNADAVLTIGDLRRQDNGAVAFLRLGATQPAQFGLNAANSDSRVLLNNINGALPAPFALLSGGMLAPWLVDGGNVAATISYGGFLDYGANGIMPTTYGDTNFAAPAANKVTDVTATSAPASTSVYALRIGGAAGGAFGLTGTNTITIGASASAADGAGLILNTITAAQTNTPNFTFGTGGNREAVIYASGTFGNTLSGAITAAGLTKFGPQPLTLTGLNTGLAGTITLNQGTLNMTPVAANFRPIQLNAGILQINAAANANIYNSNITVNGDSSIDTGTNLLPRIKTLTVNARTGGSADPITLNSVAGGLSVTGTAGQAALTLNGPVNLNQVTGGNQYIFGNGALGTTAIAGAGALNKFGSGQVIIASSSPAFSGAITINGVGGNNNNNLLRSQDAGLVDTPFGTGAITVNPGGVLSVALPSANFASNASVTMNSDQNGLATIAMNYNGNAALPGYAGLIFNNSSLNGPFAAVLAVDAVGFSGAVDLNTFAGGTAFLGSANQTGNFTGTLTPSAVGLAGSVPGTGLGSPFTTSAATGVYRVGAGGGTLQFLGAPGQFAAGNDIQIGVISNVHQYTSVSLANGNGGAAIYNVNAGFNGNIILNGSTNTQGQGNLVVGNDGALGTGTIIFNGGGIQSDTSTGLPFFTPVRTISNPIQFAGDAVFNGGTNLNITSALNLAPGQSGVTRIFNVANTTGLTILSGAITDGAGGSVNSINKTGAGPLVLAGGALNTYTGFTNLTAGTLVVGSDTDIPLSSQIVMNGGALGVWNSSFTTNRTYVATATSSIFDIGAGKTLTEGALANVSGNTTLVKSGFGTMVLNTVNSMNGTNAVQVNAGTLSVSANPQMGDPAVNGVIILNAAPSATVAPATLLVTGTFSTPRAINSVNNSSGVVNVASGQTFTSTGVINLGTGNFVKSGPGTLVTTGTNTGTLVTISDGTWSAANNQPFAATAAVNFNGGTLLLNNTAANQTVATSGNVAFSGGGHLALTTGAAFSTVFNSTGGFNRGLAGTLIIEGSSVGTLGTAGVGNVRVVPTNMFGFNLARGSALNTVSGGAVYGASLISADAAGLGNFVSNDAANGLKPWDTVTSATTTLSGAQAALIGDITAPQALAGTNSINGFRASAAVGTISGGTLKVGSVNSILEGGIIINGDTAISSALFFDPSSTAAPLSFAGGATTNASAAVTVTSTAGMLVGMPITGTNIPAGATVTAITSATALTISANATGTGTGLTFNTTQYGPTSGEGLLFVAPGATATVTGSLLATSLVKFGGGNLTLNGAGQNILGQLTVQEGTLKVGAASNFNKLQTDLVLNDRGTFDLNGTNASFASLGNSSSLTVGGGIIGNSGATAATFTVSGTGTAAFGGQIVDTLGAGTSTTALAKHGTGTLTLGIYNTTNTSANDNTFTGGTTVTLGSLVVQNPLGLGTGPVTLTGGTLNLQSNGGGINGTIILGNQSGIGSTVNVNGPGIINVDRVGANSGNAWQIGALNLAEHNLSTTGANNYYLRVAGTTTILGNYGSVTTGSASASGTLELAGPIVAPNGGALNKFGADQSRYLVISGTANTYAGGTNIQSGSLIVNATTGTPLGTGRVNVFNNGTLRLTGVGSWANGTIGGAPVKVHSAFNALAEVGLDNDNFDPVPWLNAPGVLNNSYGTIGIALSRPFYTRALDQSVIGDGRTFLTGGINVEVSYIAPTLAPGLGDGTVNRIYRLAGGGNNTLAFTGVDNVLSDYGGATQVQIGSPTSIANNGAVGLTGNTVAIRNSNNYTGGTIIWKGSALQIETGASPGTSNSPLGTGTVDIWGTLTSAGQNGSFVNGATGLNTNTFILHPGGQITINDIAGTVTGSQGRWSDTAGLNLNGGTLQFNGVTGYASVEAIGTVTVDKLSRIVVNRSQTAGVATITTPGLTRVTAGGGNGAGALLLQGSVNGSFGIPASTTVTTADNGNYDRLIITGAAPALGGNTTVGANVTAGISAAGMAAPWIINTNDPAGNATFVTYSPTTAGNTGFQPIVTAGSPGAQSATAVNANGTYTVGANQVGYSRVFGVGSGATLSAGLLTAGTETVDFNGTGTVTLADAATSVYALRTNRDLNPLAGASPSLTIVGGGLIAHTNNQIINNAPVPNNAVAQNMTLNFGVGGAAEAVIFSTINLTINAQIKAAGLTKLATQNNGGQLILTGDNLLTGPVTIDGGLIIAQNTLSGIGSAVPGVFNGQDVYLGGGVAAGNVRLVLNGTVGNAVSALQPSAFAATTKLGGTIFVNGDSQLDNNNNGISQRVTNLTIADLGAQKPVALLLGSNMYVEGTTTLASNTALNMFFNNSYSSTLAGVVAGPGLGGSGGQLNKYGNGLLLLSNAANTYSGGTTINSSGSTTTSIVGSMVRGAGTPFGTGTITVNPGGALRILDSANIASNVVNVITDGLGLGGLNFGYTATDAQISALFGTGAGKANFTSTGDFAGVIGLDANNWNGSINIATLEAAAVAANAGLAGKPLWIGTSSNPVQQYLNSGLVNYAGATITPGMGNVLRIGGGGAQGSLALGAGQFENVITAGTSSILVGTDTGGINANGPIYINGVIGMLELTTRNLAFTGEVTVAGGSQLTFSNANALANAPMINVNGGGLNIRNSQTVPNAITVTGDQFRTGENTGFDSATFSGTVNLAPNGVGGTRTFIAASNAIGFTNVISDGGTGTGASNIIRTSNQANNNLGSIVFHAANTYHGTTEIRGGFLYAGTDVQPNIAGAFGISDTPVSVAIAANPGGNSAAQLGIAGQFNFGRDIIFGSVGPSGVAVTELRTSTLQTAVVTGGISLSFGTATAGTGVAVSSFSTANGIGGVLDLQGPITGTGALQIGAVTGTVAGAVRLSANSNGLGTSTFSGGVNIWGGRLQIAADTNFTGTASAPVIISGPLGTGTLVLGRQGSNTAGQGNQAPVFVEIDAYGADRVIENPLGAINQNGDTTINFGGHHSLTFANAATFDINTDGTLRQRTFAVLATQGTVTFNGTLNASGANFGRIIKTGAGTLVLNGNNTINYAASGNPLAVNQGTLQFTADTNLGVVSAATASTINLGGGVLQLAGANTVTWASGASNRSLALLSASAVSVTDAAGILQLNTAVTGLVGLTKIGAGTLRLNSGSNSFGNLTLGGFPVGGGTVSTTASGTPFGTAVSTITINSGTLSLIGGAAAQAITTANLEFRGGAYIQLNKGTTGSALTATALTRGATVPQGTLTLLPSALANLGTGPSATSENVITSSAFANTAGMLTLPNVYARLAGTGQDADFVQYGGANGFTLRGVNAGDGATVGATLAAGNAIIPAGAADASGGVQTVNAVRTSADLAGTGALTITSGGLILNPNTVNANAGVTISNNLVFGATGTGEALIYTADGTSSVHTISGSITAGNFTKSGPGTLLLSGTGNVMAPITTGVGLRVLQINEGTLQFAGQSSLPSGGQVFINPMDTARFDLNGQNLNISGLGTGTSSLATGTGNIINSGAAATLTVSGTGVAGLASTVTTQFNGLISGNIALVKSGTSTQILGANTQPGIGGNTYTGGTTINTGFITSGSGIFTSLGTLQVRGVNTLGAGPITLAGGILEFNNAIAGSDMYTNIVSVLQGGTNGYDVTVPALNNFGSANTTSAFATNSTVNWQAINSLTVNAPVITFGGASGNGVLVKGTTAFNQDTTLNVAQQAIFAGTLSASGRTLTKIGASSLFLTGTGGDTNGTGGAANAVGGWNILAGTLEVRTADGGSNPFGGANTILLDGSTVNVRHDGDNLADPQNISTFSGNTIVSGSLTAASSASYMGSTNSTLQVGTLSAGANKTIQFSQLQFGGPLGAAFLTTAAINGNYSIEFVNGLTMIKDAYLANSNQVTIDVAISGNGTLFKQNGGELDINTVATNTGGTVAIAGTINFGSFQGNTRTLSTTAKLAPGNITLNPSALIRFNSTSNLNGGQLVDIRSNVSNLALVGIGDNSTLGSYNLRVPQAFGAPNSNLLLTPNQGGGVIALNSVYSQALDLGKIGDGTFFLGSNNNGAGVTAASSVNGTYTGPAIAASPVSYNFGVGSANNANPTYRLGGGGTAAFLNIGTIGGTEVPALVDTVPNVTIGSLLPVALATNVVVGAPLTNSSNAGAATVVGNGTTAGVFFNTAQTYTGTTLVNSGSVLEIRSTVATSGFEAFGTLAVGGSGGTFAGSPTPVVHPGATIRLDNSLDLLPTGAAQGRWGDTTPVVLDGSTFTVFGNSTTNLTETVGAVTVNGYSTITPRRMFAARIMEINAASVARGTGGILNIEGVNGGQIGSDERVTAATIANYAGLQVSTADVTLLNSLGAVQNGMVAPWMYDNRDSQFLTYAGSGFVGAGFNYVNTGGTQAATVGTGTERMLVNTATANLPVGGALNVWALRTDAGVGLVTVTDTTASVTIGSGGIINGQNVSITPKIVFGSIGTPVEAIINTTGNTLVLGDIANPTVGQITATGITKGSAGTLQLDAEQATFNGPIHIGGGALTLRTNATTTTGGNPAAYSGTTYAGGNGNTIYLNGAGVTLNFRSDHTVTTFGAAAAYGQVGALGVATELGAETFAKSIEIRAGNPSAVINFDRAASTTVTNQGISISGGLTFGGSPGDQGQILTVNGANGMNAQGTGFNFWVNGVTNVGPAGYAVFNLTNGNNQSMSLAGGITGAGTLVKEGASSGTLFIGVNGVAPAAGAGSGFTGGVTVLAGNLQANALAPASGVANGVVSVPAADSLLGSGAITLAGGQLNVRVDNATGVGGVGGTALVAANLTTQTFNMANTVTVIGNTTINTDRIGDLQILPNASVTSGSNIATVVNGTTAGLKIGQTLSGTNVSGTVTGITDATHFTMSANAGGAGTVSTTITAVSAFSNNIIAFPTLNIGGQTLTNSAGNTYGLGFNAVNLSGTPTFTANNDLNLTGVTDNGGGLYIVKNGGGQLWMSSTVANTYSGGTVINQGLLRFGRQLAVSTTATAGTGLITINAQGAVRLENATNLNVGQQLQVNGIPNSPAVVRILGTATISAAQVQSAITANSSRGALLLEATYANALDLSLIGDGTFYLGSQGNISYTANTLTAGAGGVYRLGQNNAVGSVLTLAPTTASSPVLSTGSLIVGSLAAGFNNGTGTVLLNATNTFAGGSTVARLSNLRFTTGATQGFGGSGLLNTPLGSGSVDAFGTLTAEGTAGGFVDQSQTAATNTVNIHPGAIIRLDNNTSITGAVTGTGAGSQITGLASTAGLSVGMTVISTTAGFPTGGTTIVSIDSANAITLAAAPPAGALAGIQFASNNRWNDSTPVALNGAQFFVNGLNTGISNETVGSLTFAAGSNIRLLANGTNGQAVLTIGGADTFSRAGRGTMVFNDGAAGRLGLAAASGSERVIVSAGVGNILDDAATPVVISNGMLPAYYVAGTDNQFVTYNAVNGFTRVPYTAAALNLPAGRIAGTDLAQVTGNVTLADNPNIYALGVTAAATISSAPGQINTITLDGSGATAKTFGGIIAANAAITINPNIKAGANGEFELPIFSNGSTLQLNGDISATGITKFGAGTLAIGKDQSDLARGPGAGYSSGWVVNEGQITPLTFGSLGNATGTNSVTLNGATVSPGNATVTNASTLRLQLNQANTGIGYYSMGNLNVLDNGGISYDPAADDRTQALGSAGALSNVVVASTGGSLLDAQFSLNTNRNRTVLLVGDLSLSGANAGVQVNIITSAQGSNVTSGISSGLSVASLTGTSDQRVDKWGNGILYVRGASTFAGAVNIEQGAVQINNTASLGDGSGTNVVTVKRFGTLDINTANFARTDVIFQSGSLLRLTSDQAISAAAFNLGGGTLQVANDQTTTTTQFTMSGGGSIEGFLRTDDLLSNGTTNGTRAVYRTLGTGVTFNLAGNSFLGQNITQGINGLDNGVQPDVFNPLLNSANGVLLEIKGAITGAGSLTKQGYDTVTLSSASNTYSGGTFVTQGMLRAGAGNVLGASDGVTSGTGNLSTSGASVFDVNGFNQSVGKLTSPAATGSAVAGYVTNTATTISTLSTGNGVTAGNDFTYSGVIQYNVALTKEGGAKMTVTKDNTYYGPTTVNGATLEVQGRLSGTSAVAVNSGATLLLNSSTNADNIVNPNADVAITSGTLQIDNSKTGTTQTYNKLTLSGTPIIDFGTGSTNKLLFQQILTNLNTFGGTLSIWNWTGSAYAEGSVLDPGTDLTQDRFLFNTDPGYGNGSNIGNVLFYSDNGLTQIGTGAGQVAFGSQFEIVPVPEPTTTMLLGSVALCALLGYRGRQRQSGSRRGARR